MQRGFCALLALWAGALSAGTILAPVAVADVILDSSFGSGVVDRNGFDRVGNFAQYLLREHAGKRVGDNLIFSASAFDLAEFETATFDGDLPTRAIILRVTSGGPSLIDGTIDSTYTGSDVFFFNPSGITFSGGAKLGPSLSGSFHASTADELHLQDGTTIPTGQVGNTQLTSAAPVAFGFLSNAPASINMQQARLTVQSGQTLGLIGGDIDISGFFFLQNLKAPAGRIQLASLAGPGVVPLDLNQFDIASLPPGSLGSIELTDQAHLDVSGFPSGSPGSLIIRAGSFQIRNGIISAANYASTGDGPQAVDIRASINVEIRSSTIDTGAVREAAAGDLLIEAPDIEVAANIGERTRIISTARSSGQGGSIELRAENSLVIRGDSDIVTETTSGTTTAGTGGDITLSGARVEIRDAGFVSASTSGGSTGGNVSVDADLLLIHTGLDDAGDDAALPGLLEATTTGTGMGGNLSVVADTVQLLEGGQLSVATDGSAGAGTLSVLDADSVEVRGLSRVPVNTGTGTPVKVPAGIFNRALANATGAGGELIIETNLLAVLNGGEISARSFGAGNAGDITIRGQGGTNPVDRVVVEGGDNGASLISVRGADGDGGLLTLNANELELRSGGQIVAEATGSGTGGEIRITAGTILIRGRDSNPMLEARNPSVISSKAIAGPGGTILIDAGEVIVEEGGQISATAVGGVSGDIDLRARVVRVDGVGRDPDMPSPDSDIPSEISAATQAGGGAGGDLKITATEAVIVSNGASISVETSGSSNSGEIELVGGGLVEISDGASVSAETRGTGAAGRITIHDTEQVVLRDGSIVASTTGFGASGSIAIGAVREVEVIDGRVVRGDPLQLIDGSNPGPVGNLFLDEAATISVESAGAADAGAIDIWTDTSVRLAGGSSLTTEASQADGGGIAVLPGQLLDLQNSTITATVDDSPSRPDQTTGGNIIIQGDNVVVQESSIVAKANQGFGGFIIIEALSVIVDENSEIDASSGEPNRSGTVEINAPDVDLAGNLVQLSESLLDVSGLLTEQCMAVAAPQGSLLVRQRVPLMSSPDDPLQSFYLGGDL